MRRQPARGSSRRPRVTSAVEALLCLSLALAPGRADAQRFFEQSRQLLHSDGRELAPLIVTDAEFASFPRRQYPLTDRQILSVVSNLGPEQAQNIDAVAALAAAAAREAEALTGLTLPGGVLLYLVAVDSLPTAYHFRATVPADSPWCELRLAFLLRGEPLLGTRGSRELAELLHDTLPHEFGHDLLDGLPALQQDREGLPSVGTRWFCEGVCELLAAARSRAAGTAVHAEMRRARDWRGRFEGPAALDRLFEWPQASRESPGHESALYGLARRVLELWTVERSLDELLADLAASPDPWEGEALRELLARNTGLAGSRLWSAINDESRALPDAAPEESFAAMSPLLPLP